MAKAKSKATAKTKATATKKPKKKAATTGSTDLVRRVTFEKMAAKNLPDFSTGDTVGVYVRVKEGEKERVQLYRGVVIKVQGSGANKTFTVRKISAGVGVERTFPMGSPAIDRVELISKGKVRRSRLFYLRGLKGRSARLNSELYMDDGGSLGAADEVATTEAAAPAATAKPEKAN
jgi:large subunit ribosomal protein L19